MKKNMTLLLNSPDLRTPSRRKEYPVHEPEDTSAAHKSSSLDETCCLLLVWLNEKKVAFSRERKKKKRPSDFFFIQVLTLRVVSEKHLSRLSWSQHLGS